MGTKNPLHKKSVFFATFAHYEGGKRMNNNGNIDGVCSFFIPKVNTFFMIVEPHPGSDRINPEVELYRSGRLVNKFNIHAVFYLPIYLLCRLPSEQKIRLSYKMRDVFTILLAMLSQKHRYDLFIGLEAVETIAGMMLKKFGRVKIVVYYVSDYSPTRFRNKLFNSFYVWLDRFCLLHSDYTWDVSPAMQKGRIKAGLIAGEKYSVIHVSNGLFPSQIASLPITKRNKYELVYMGILEPDMGVDLAIKSLVEIVKHFPKAKLHIIGGSKKNMDDMKSIAKSLKIDKSVIFYGFVPDNNKMAEIVRQSYIGLAPYRAFPHSKRWYGDAGKIRQYLASGLPVVTTHVPPLGRYIVEKGAGIMTKDTVDDFSKAVIKLLSDENLYKKLTDKAIDLSKENTWENSYKQAIEKMNLL